MADRSGEFDLIARYFRPLTRSSPGALDLTDDAAILDLPPGRQAVMTADMLIADVHFFADDPPGDIAAKALRVNLSDLAAMGAAPASYLLSLALDPSCDDTWVERFATALAADQAAFGIGMLGGDTVATDGPVTVGVTAIGTVATGQALRRSGANAGDSIFVSGTIGDASLAVMARRGALSDIGADDRSWFDQRLSRPTPRLDLGQRLAGIATAAVDISDGLVADLGHICAASGMAATIAADSVPLSEAARRQVAVRPELIRELLTGGDDYELLFTAPSARREEIAGLARVLDLPLTKIGTMEPAPAQSGAPPVTVRMPEGEDWRPNEGGYRHF